MAVQTQQNLALSLPFYRICVTFPGIMLASGTEFLQRHVITLLGRTGMVSNGPGGTGTLDEGVGLIVISSIFGAFCGLLFGFMVAHLSRFLSVIAGRNLGGFSWVFYCAAIGAVLFAAIAAMNDKD